MNHKMRRVDREITQVEDLESILREGEFCTLSVIDSGVPYIIPMNYGFESGVMWFHSAPAGRKLDAFRKNPGVCFNVTISYKMIRNAEFSQYTSYYKSVTGWGKIEIVDTPAEKIQGLNTLKEHVHFDGEANYPKSLLERVAVFKLVIDEMTGKKNGY